MVTVGGANSIGRYPEAVEWVSGRTAALESVSSLLDPSASRRLLHFVGPSGIGKSEIVDASGRLAEQRGYHVVRIDGRERAWSADALSDRTLGQADQRPLLVLLDGFEAIAHLEVAWRERCLPLLPDWGRVISAGRFPLVDGWREDFGWRALAEEIELRPLSLAESMALVARQGLDHARAARVAQEAHGNPLALVLLAHAVTLDPGVPVRPMRASSAAQVLLDRLALGSDRSPLDYLEAAAIVPTVDEDLLGAVLDAAPGSALESLRGWRFVRVSSRGLAVHDAVRAAIRRGLARRDPGHYQRLLHAAGSYYLDRWPSGASGGEAAGIAHAAAVMILEAQDHPDESADGGLALVPARPDHSPAVERMVLEREGPESLARFQQWRAMGAEILVCRGESPEPLGFLSMIDLARTPEVAAGRDPAVKRLWRAWRDEGVLATGRAHLVRHWMSAAAYQSPCPVQSVIMRHITDQILQGASAMGQCVGDHDMWRQLHESLPRRRPELDFVQDGRPFLILTRELGGSPPSRLIRDAVVFHVQLWSHDLHASPAAPRQTDAAHEREAFAHAVREALRHCDRPDLLRASPLLASRWLLRHADTHAMDRVAAGRALAVALREDSRRLFASPRDEILDRIVELTFFRRTGKQEAIAAELGMAYSTYRRQLAGAVKRLVDALWIAEHGTIER